ncbi:MAG: alginate export family protein [Ignavibacteria bacterium]|nr:alginate export family protein [Ignavibacteria bacterium]MBT8382380.1 alginate export family protein [Ignavibacteria bacterium]MBT8391834.1 alginate export family protein [Ignavibacteria bacterium]NNJ51895.1 alginate export family protein [Ignavibacteriaceae bacterium]NNL21103.1 alginate export family protein [Ignavibacteriaceae bacterium]
MKTLIKIFLVSILLVSTNFSQQDLGDGWQILGQVMLRSELDGRDFSNSTHPLTFASSRIRLGVAKTFDEKVQLFIQAQDSRVFGSESNTLSNSKNLDLHQGFVKLTKLFGWNFSFQAGRFEVSYGTQRFIGAVGWHFVGRSFDGARLTIAPNKWDLDIFALTVKESVSYIGNATSSTYPFPQEPTPASSIYGIWKKTNIDDANKFDLFGYWEVDREKVGVDSCKLNKATFGGTYWGIFGNFSTIVEAAYQLGDQAGKDVSAYLISAQGHYKIGIAKVGLGADILSGTKPTNRDKVNTFYPTYGTNHKFYGFMDYFINIPVNTLNLGLHDFYFKAKIVPENSEWEFAADFHHFMSNQTAVSNVNGVSKDVDTFGQEVDLTIGYNFIKGTKLIWGGSFFFQGDIMKSIFDPREDTAYWTYVMVVANL